MNEALPVYAFILSHLKLSNCPGSLNIINLFPSILAAAGLPPLGSFAVKQLTSPIYPILVGQSSFPSASRANSLITDLPLPPLPFAIQNLISCLLRSDESRILK